MELDILGSHMTAAWPLVRRAALLLTIAYGCILVAMAVLEPILVFPVPRLSRAQLGFAAGAMDAQEVMLTAEDGTSLYGWRIGEGDVLVLLFTGNGSTVAAAPERYRWIRDHGMSLLHVNYRGYPGSEGHPSEAGLAQDARAAWAEALRTHPPDRILLVGKSLGGGVALRLAAELGRAGGTQPGGLILLNTFLSAAEVGQSAYPWLPVRWLMRNRFDSAALAPEVRCPAIVVHGEADMNIPARHGRTLADLLPDATFIGVPGKGHNDFVLDAAGPTLAKLLEKEG